jgi:tellurite resistance protein TerC
LRSLYFALAALMDRFRYLKMSLVFLLAFVGLKMILAHHHPIPVFVSLATIGVILAVGVLASVFMGARDTAPLESPLTDALEEFYRATTRTVWRVFILLAGSTLLLIGTALLVLPGPGILTLVVGLAVLATQFVWARAWLARARILAKELADDARDLVRSGRGTGK